MIARLSRALLAAMAATGLAWSLGFAWFVSDARRPSPWPSRADGIVVLTGGALRVETGLGLLQAGISDRLLISGVPPGIMLPDIIGGALHADAGLQPAVIDTAYASPGRRITIGHGAATTVGNAVETAEWAQANGLRSLVVVTAGYHMRRAIAELDAVLPQLRLQRYAVHPGGVGLVMLVREYDKLLAVALGLVPRPEAGTA